jgi:hypothetical protein
MRDGCLTLIGAALAAALGSTAVIVVHGQTRAPKATAPSTFSRTAWGDPDLQGVWNYAAGTPFERPAEFAGKATLNDEELAREEARVRERGNGDRRDDGRADLDLNREHNEFWFSRRTRILTRRTSLITDPVDGKLPPMTPNAVQAQAARAAAQRVRGPADSWEDRSLNERCLINEAFGPPILPRVMLGGIFDIVFGHQFHFRILQSAGYVTILAEYVQGVRIIPLDARPHIPGAVQQWLGDSRGHWEGNTLVVETTNFHTKRAVAGFPAEKVRLVERWARTERDTLDYQFTVDDPTTWTKPWTAAVPIERTNGEIYEFACHEGNYGLANILSAARSDERQSGAAAQRERE